MNTTTKSKRTCTCKLLPWNLSTNTAAEYGDLGSLTHRLSKSTNDSTKVSSSTSEPLHLAAQHGHISITSFLLKKGYHADSGSTDAVVKPNVSTPLHRACYSGAIGCVKLLLDHDANVLARDISFGDGMTPLHKAVKGGRYLAVAVVIKHCASVNLLEEVLGAVDSSNQTALELALELQSKGEDEILSLRRWDSVAGGSANFSKCIELLEDASDYNKSIKKNTETKNEENDTKLGTKNEDNDKNSANFQNTVPDCECENADNDGKCNTAAWENAFRNAILKSTASMICQDETKKPSAGSATGTSEVDPNLATRGSSSVEKLSSGGNTNVSQPLHKGQPCQSCNKESIALWRSCDGLVCRKCLRRPRSKILSSRSNSN